VRVVVHTCREVITHLMSKENGRIKAPKISWIVEITQRKQIFSVFSQTQQNV
jgi:hypothetical protein